MFEHHSPRKNRLFILFTILLVVVLVACCGDEDEASESDQYTIGIINLTSALNPIIDGFKSQMTELGYVEGENLTYIYDDPPASIEELDRIAQKLVEADVDLILCITTPATQAVLRATAENPIPGVFAPIQDPVGSGLVASMAEPGGNVTGVMMGGSEDKRLEWLTQIVPGINRVYIPYNVDDPAPVAALELIVEAADYLEIELVLQPARNTEEVAAAIENIPDDIDTIMILPDSIVSQSMNELTAAAIEHKIPLSGTIRDDVVNGALMSYGMDATSVGGQVARLANHILKGVDPAILPVEVAEFYLAINLQTAEAIGLEISDDILRQTDFIIREEG